ncbi:MAG: RDD family protein [Chloroflexi bacterium]|nr:RDD family protein [Chloroflexota bacterium]
MFLGLVILYYFVFELLTGTTPGKAILGLRVVHIGDNAERVQGIIFRNILRLIDGLPFFYLLGLAFIATTDNRQRLGDLAGKTTVGRVIRSDGDSAINNDGKEMRFVGMENGAITATLRGYLFASLLFFVLCFATIWAMEPDSTGPIIFTPFGAFTPIQVPKVATQQEQFEFIEKNILPALAEWDADEFLSKSPATHPIQVIGVVSGFRQPTPSEFNLYPGAVDDFMASMRGRYGRYLSSDPIRSGSNLTVNGEVILSGDLVVISSIYEYGAIDHYVKLARSSGSALHVAYWVALSSGEPI